MAVGNRDEAARDVLVDADGGSAELAARPPKHAPTLARMWTTGRAAFTKAFIARHTTPGRAVLERPGMCGANPSDSVSPVRLLITDDRARDELADLLPAVRTGRIDVFAEATSCLELIHRELGWRSKASTAMACLDLRATPKLTLTDELTLRPVRRWADDHAADGVPLEAAVAVAVSADPTIDEPPAVFAAYLQSLPPTFRLFAAVDGDGAARATSGVGAFGSQATVLFVNTHPSWRLRGTGRAMTAIALHAARAAGAEQACLNASEAGMSIYRRLGFETVAQTTRFFSPA